MIFQRKIIALLFALLIGYISLTYYSAVVTIAEKYGIEGSENNRLIIGSDQTFNFFLQEKNSSKGFESWRNVIHFPGNDILCKFPGIQPRYKPIRKIFVVNPSSYTSCKAAYFYPFHEFS